MELTQKDIETIQRALGKIEGVAFAVDSKVAVPLVSATETIDKILKKEEGGSDARKID